MASAMLSSTVPGSYYKNNEETTDAISNSYDQDEDISAADLSYPMASNSLPIMALDENSPPNSPSEMSQLNSDSMSSPGPLMLTGSPELSPLSPPSPRNFDESPKGLDQRYNCNGDVLSPQHPQNFSVTPVIENGQEIFYCHLCSFSSPSRLHINCHLDSHFEHKCIHCDYTSRTEGRLKQHIARFHNLSAVHGSNDMLCASPSDPSCNMPPPNLPNDKGPQLPRTPTSSSASKTPGRQKVYRCKQCDFVATVKTDFWQHARVHIKEDKILQCPKCPFVTEYKHHLEYHLRNHFGSKPFKCTKCNYACVNKSMLNSHMKSHTNIYQYRCADCTYATKYCHSLKLHLRKYNHKPASIINLDGTIDHDTSSLLVNKRAAARSGKKGTGMEEEQQTHPMMRPNIQGMPANFPPPPHMMPFWPMPGVRPGPPPLIPVSMGNLFRGMLPHQILNTPQLHRDTHLSPNAPSKCTKCDVICSSKEELTAHMMKHHYGENREMFNGLKGNGDHFMKQENYIRPPIDMTPNPAVVNMASFGLRPFGMNIPIENNVMQFQRKEEKQDPPEINNSESCETPLDLSKCVKMESLDTSVNTSACTPGRRRSRKGKAYKLDALCLKLQDKIGSEDGDSTADAPIMPQLLKNDHDAMDDSTEDTLNENNTPTLMKQEHSEQNNNEQSTEATAMSNTNELMKKAFAAQNGLMSLNKGNVGEGDLPHDSNEKYNCPFCDISFTNCVMYTMHMGYHGYKNPFKCNMCGDESTDKVAFFLHIARTAHA